MPPEGVGMGQDVRPMDLVVSRENRWAGACLALVPRASWSRRILSGVARLTPLS